ncbi:hypothetical protein B0H14DRAFT_2383394, partial [Mycena olivaceomarginata]
VERAFNAFTATGVRSAAIPKFSKAESGTAVAGYAKNISRFTSSRWGSLLKACGVRAESGVATPEDMMVLDGVRDSMYILSSP